MDINIALLMIVVLFPFFIIISLLIKITSRGPIVSNILRTGWRGQQIKVYRFRTMFPDEYLKINPLEAELKLGFPEPEIGKDNRYTKIGRFLYKSGLDQLPQLFNILKGEIPVIIQRHALQNDSIRQNAEIEF